MGSKNAISTVAKCQIKHLPFFTLAKVVQNIIKNSKKKKEEKYRKKCSIIFQHTMQFYYDNFVNTTTIFKNNTTREKTANFSWFAYELYRKNWASAQAKEQLHKIIQEKRIEDVYKALVRHISKTVEI